MFGLLPRHIPIFALLGGGGTKRHVSDFLPGHEETRFVDGRYTLTDSDCKKFLHVLLCWLAGVSVNTNWIISSVNEFSGYVCCYHLPAT
jgi:hypothetical protein